MKLRIAILTLALIGALLLVWFRLAPQPSHPAPVRPNPEQGNPPVVVTYPLGPAAKRQDLPPAPAGTKIKVDLFSNDRRRAPAAQVILLGDRKVMTDVAAGDAEGPSSFELEAFGKNQRIIIIPDDPDLAILVHDLTITEGEAKSVSLILQRGMEVTGVVVNTRGEPMASKPVSTEIALPPDSRARREHLAHRVGIGVEFRIDDDKVEVTTTTDKQGRFRLVSLPSSVTKVGVTVGKGQVEQFGTGVALRLVMPDGDHR